MKRFFYDLLARRIGYTGDEDLRTSEERLSGLLIHAARTVPYYRTVLVDAGVVSVTGGSVHLDRLSHLPLLTKDIIRARTSDLISSVADMKTARWNSSGGSTGEPVRFLQDGRYLRSARRTTYEQERWTGYRLGDRLVKLWGDEREVFEGSQGLRAWFMNGVKRQTFLNAFLMTPERMREYIGQLNRLQPRLVVAYAQAMYELCMFAEQQHLSITGPRAVMTSAGTLYPFMREVIERVCAVKVFDRYGSREVSNVAAECEEHDGMHIAGAHAYVEVVDSHGVPCPLGVEGEIVVTTLENYTMPLIRYRIGDSGALKEGACRCGRPGPILDTVIGRSSDAFKTASGKVITGIYFIHLIGVSLNRGVVRKVQMIQRAFDDILVRIVPAEGFTAADEKEIVEKIQKVMDPGCRVTIENVADIPVLPSGKYRYTIREIP